MRILQPESTMKFIAIAATSCLLFLVAPVSAQVDMEVMPWTSALECEGERIDFEGQIRFHEKLLFTDDRVNYFFQMHYHGKGVSESGDVYTAHQNIVESFHNVLDPDQPQHLVYVLNDIGAVIGKGTAPSYSATYRIKVHIVDGEVIIESFDFDVGPCVFL